MPHRLRRLIPLLPIVLFVAVLAWRWRIVNLATGVPAYGDVLEVIWGSEWLGRAIPSGRWPYFHPHVFYPKGWHLGTFAYGPATFATLLPLSAVAGPVVAYNVVTLFSLALAYAGMWLLLRRPAGSLPAAVAALLYAFWGYRWLLTMGALNLGLGSAILPWFLWSLERGRTEPRPWHWHIAAGAAWAYAAANSLYFLWIGGLVWLVWTLVRSPAPGERRRARLAPAAIGLLLSLPAALLFWEASRAAMPAPYSLGHMNDNGASLNALTAPFVYHPLLGPVATALYRGPVDASGTANFGLLATAAGLLALPLAWRRREARYLAALWLAGMALALGPTLKWDGQSLAVAWLEPLNQVMWRLGHALKPALFTGTAAPAPFDQAIPLPWLALATVVPFWEGARVTARFAFAAALGLFPLLGLALAWLARRRGGTWLAGVLGVALLAEAISFPILPVPYPPAPHPAYLWLRDRADPYAAVLDLYEPLPDVLNLVIGGETLLAQTIHGRPIVSGGGSVWPAHTQGLIDWLWAHPRPDEQPDLLAVLAATGARYLLLHGGRAPLWAERFAALPDLAAVGCFDPPDGVSPWEHAICIVAVPETGVSTRP